MGSRRLITEREILDYVRQGQRTIRVDGPYLLTPLAADAARANGIVMVAETVRPDNDGGKALQSTPPADQRIVLPIAIGADHGGFELKMELSKHIESGGRAVLDVGTHSNARCDYPDFAYAVAIAVKSRVASCGIMIDGAGPGSAIVANKVPGIRAACAYNEFAAWNARAHNDCNVLTLGSRATGIEVCKRIVDVFFSTGFEGGRHQGRVDKIRDVETRFASAEYNGRKC